MYLELHECSVLLSYSVSDVCGFDNVLPYQVSIVLTISQLASALNYGADPTDFDLGIPFYSLLPSLVLHQAVWLLTLDVKGLARYRHSV